MEKLCIVYIPVSNENEGANIGEKIVTAKLAACANVFSSIRSIYLWEGSLEENNEAVLILKTKESLVQEVENAVKELHSYSCPCIMALPVIHANKEFIEWVERETK